MKARLAALAILIVSVMIGGMGGSDAAAADIAAPTDAIFQVSVINALMEGAFDGVMDFDELGQYGDFGLGTLHAVDGEMLALDGVFYQLGADGFVRDVTGSGSTPFSVVAFFVPERQFFVENRLSQPGLEELIGRAMASSNVPYAIRIDGLFAHVKVRSIFRQSQPYPRLDEVVREQVEFDYENMRGTVVGFWTPFYFEGVNVPGFHFHFISEDRRHGGHVLALESDDVVVALDQKDRLVVDLPVDDPDFRLVDFGKQSPEELERIEGR